MVFRVPCWIWKVEIGAICIFVSSEDAFSMHVFSEPIFHFLKLVLVHGSPGSEAEVQTQFEE